VLYRFNIELSDVDRNVYETLDFRIQQHPSEIPTYLLTRVLAYALSYQSNLEFSASGLSDPDTPALQAKGDHGSIDLWIEIGNPSAKKLHKAGKTAKQVVVYTYKSAEVLIADIKNNDVHRASDIQIYSFDAKFLASLEKLLQKNNRWSLVLQQAQLDVTIGEQTISTEVIKK
jgi:uncharacterized protein YaeQ